VSLCTAIAHGLLRKREFIFGNSMKMIHIKKKARFKYLLLLFILLMLINKLI